ncbi:response regulator [Actomonas aquatica]|uniref:Response regulator n=1 Tax=Actomonas aquatica TaxID=2866162 RepID=A0ABZ1CEN0_9BACT|nr:response regulator [Opitutus sp. WL0086]WRQ88740.1 response regulator [Opitutus sp. WL0086]
MKPRILLVEDNDSNVYLVRFLLERAGMEVLHAANGQEGVAMAQSEQPDLVVMDLQMPVMDGYEAARLLKANPATSDLPLIASSAYAQPHDEQKALDAGFSGYIAKPFEPDTFAEIVRSYLR